MIDEIPERDHKPNQASSSMSLTRLAILLTMIFAVLLAMLLGWSRALDTLAAKLWPAPNNNPNNNKETLAQNVISSSLSVPIPNSLPPFKFDQSKEQATVGPTGNANLVVPTAQVNSTSTEVSVVTAASSTPQLNTSTIKRASSASASNVSLGSVIAESSSSVTDPNTALNMLSQKKEDLQKGETLALSVNTDNKAESVEPLEASLKNANEAMQQEKVNKLQQSQKTAKKQVKIKDAKQYTVAEKEILKNDPRHYTVQILGMHNKAKLKQFMNETKLQGKVRYCRGAHQGKPWYVLVYGEYTTREEAQRVIAALPAEVQKQKPWIRSFASLQGTIHARE